MVRYLLWSNVFLFVNLDRCLFVSPDFVAGVHEPLVVVVLPDVHAEVAPLLGLVRAVGALVGWGLAAALDVLVPAQGRLPAVLLAAVPALELTARVVRVVAVSLAVVRFGIVFGIEHVTPRQAGAALVRVGVVERVGLLREHDIVGIVVLPVGLVVVLLGVLVVQALGDRVVVLHEGLLEQVRLDVLGDRVEGVERHLGQEVVLEHAGDLDAGRHERRQRLRLRALRRQQRQQRRR